MKYISRILLIGCLIVGLVTGTRVNVSAANMEILVTPTSSANAGDAVSVQMKLNKNPGITTFATSMAYDDSVLEYNGATWLTSISSNSSNMLLVSNVEENGQQKLNISAVLNNVYSTSGETFVTLNFTAKQAFTSMPVTVEARDISDGNYESVDATIVVEKGANSGDNTESQTDSSTENNNSENNNSENNNSENKNSENNSSENNNSESENNGSGNNNSESENNGSGNNNSESESNDPENDNSESESEEEPETDDSESDSEDDSEPDNNGTGKTNNGSSSNSNKNGSNGNHLDATFKTGATDPKVIFGVIAIILVAGAGGCMVYLRRKKI